MTTSRFITFEGTEGVGKTTLIDNLAQVLTERKIDFIRTREPGGSLFAEELRKILINPKITMANDSELLLMFAARADHIEQTILPALNSGKWVLCDRFTDSTFAYQGFGRGHGNFQMLAKVQFLIDNFVAKMPDTTIWLDFPVLDGMQRAKNRGALDRFEQENKAFFERIYQGFVYLAQNQPERFKRIDAACDEITVLNRVLAVLNL
ncbi:thymidylate kinase [Moraxella macacae 0408225]|uniref:Thymidylate kinase n=1 Tax=Moraxella macacae 0408225 TaxID=1230338 RepID=L2F7F2_9GAMM|nr:dTMP kinase [Moraxella macacae]ELA09004.1 thymidylate kinase [Moraxella macacae 0408225]